MERIQKSIDVHVPVHVAYNQWTQFEEFPRFMEGVKEVRQLDDQHVHWVAEIGGKEKEWDAEIIEQLPDRRVAWRSVDGTPNGGSVEFDPVSGEETHVTVMMEYEPEGFMENVADFFGATSSRVEGDLERFKEFVESRGTETGAWRGEIHEGREGSRVAMGMASGTSSTEGSLSSPELRGEDSTLHEGMTDRSPSEPMRRTSGEEVIPEVQEELKIGKRQVERGGVRVKSKLREERVEDQVRLREERARVEHRDVDRPLEAGDDAFRERTIEVRETAEEPVVAKRARVTGEVRVGKEVSERTETVGDTVRRTEVHVDQLGGGDRVLDDSDFRSDWQTRYSSSGGRFEDYSPAYTYGHGLRSRYAGREWNDIETDVRRDWEAQRPGTWERFKDAIRTGWNRTTGKY